MSFIKVMRTLPRRAKTTATQTVRPAARSAARPILHLKPAAV